MFSDSILPYVVVVVVVVARWNLSWFFVGPSLASRRGKGMSKRKEMSGQRISLVDTLAGLKRKG